MKRTKRVLLSTMLCGVFVCAIMAMATFVKPTAKAYANDAVGADRRKTRPNFRYE